MILHNNKEDFENLINLTAKEFNISEVYIEKDYWVTYILKTLSSSKHIENIVFKGGTSLSKAYSLIERFSEDIDLQLINFEGSNSQIKNKIKEIEKDITLDLRKLEGHPRESKHGSIRKTIYAYDRVIDDNNFFQGSEELVLEINAMSIPEPYEKKKLRTYIAEFMDISNNSEYINEYKLEEFEVNVLDKKRTFVEKIFAVLDFSFKEDYISELSNKIRHLYDIYKLYSDSEVKEFFNSEEFFEMSNRVVVENDFYGKRKETKYNESILYDIDVLDKIKKVYEETFSAFVFGDLPDFNLIKLSLKEILDRISIWEEKYRGK